MTDAQIPPTTAEELRAAILARYDGLSKRLQQIARYVLDEPNELALETLAVIAERSGVQPSAIVRFAKSFGFDGASQMQRLFRDGLLSGHAALGYSERVRNFSRAVDNSAASGGAELLSEFVEGNTIALQNLPQTVSDADLTAAVRLVEACDTVFVVGVRRAFPIAAYLAYSLQQAGKRTTFVDGVAGLARQQVGMIRPEDLLIAVSYQPYAEETVHAVEAAATRGAPVLSISDSLVSPIAKPATVTLQVRESEIRAFRSLSASMCLAQALVIGFAFEASRKEDAKNRRKR
ncbi:MurR/RpiR family transcriptional regulator [Phenylobacterium sp.]|uniref:MurR/RpiR family transcriptional regulator n=1 Tax=Phenylobacterium sp. TaxID=1871053 RepID=UPI0025CED9F7|nr:MurR/RpiR family transcriptional regulator [Phenylobacterium sp.]MBX3484109.1 MurR/RpiR family transcriptional regulator [Phenylobacterium sp.]MCW5759632.1 MurR/RpiR family transcriptional regulator [Phenylobacterium sp.]